MISESKVLVADDTAYNRFILESHLKNLGISNTFFAENGRKALEALRSHQLDLVLLDIMMPEVDGCEVLGQMKADENLQHIPVVMITSLDDTAIAAKCIQVGAEDYIHKPFNPALLRARITACLEKKHLHDIERRYLRLYDFTTGLPNQELFMKHLGDELQRRQQPSSLFGLFIVRLNGYRMILDGLGQGSGDKFLFAQGKRLENLLPSGALLACLAQNEFAVILNGLDCVADYTALAQQIHRKLEEPLTLKEHDISGSLDIGMAFSSTGYNSSEDMLRDARLAANRARQNNGCQIFDETMHKEAMNRLGMETELKRALAEKQFHLFYQPIVMLSTGKIIGFEALIRWQHPDKGWILPGEFIPLAEETGFIVPMGAWVLMKACRQAADWKTLLGNERPITIAVNVSAHQLREKKLLDTLGDALSKAQLDGSGLKLELTETALIANPDQVDKILIEVQQLGIKTALDDFGTGYCSLSYLHRFSLDTLKIDRSFVKHLETKHKNHTIVQSTIELAHKLGMDVVAEGVETDKEAAALHQMNCEYGQGMLYHSPMPAEDAAKLLFKNAERELSNPLPIQDQTAANDRYDQKCELSKM